MNRIWNIPRRDFLKLCPAAGVGLALGVYVGSVSGKVTARPESKFAPNAFLSIDSGGKVTIWATRSEMGQGVRTSLPMIVAEELEVDWAAVHVEQAFFNPKFGNQNTGGSGSLTNSWEVLRKAGATGREMLILAAAQTWGVAKENCRAQRGTVIHVPSRMQLTYGALVDTASKLPVPKEVPLKDPKSFRIIGTSVPRTDTPAKVNGSAVYGLDVRIPGMLYATVARCPVFGGRASSFDPTRARSVPGVRNVVQISTGIAVVAESTWAAIQGRQALEIKWNEGRHASESTDGLRQSMAELSGKPGKALRNDGDVTAALTNSAKRVEAVYETPFLAHGTMEPMNCTAHVRPDGCEIWTPSQFPGWANFEAQRITNLPPTAIRMNITFLGGGFGRRINPDFVIEAVETSKAVAAPVKLVWTRDDDMQHDFYRPASYQRLTGGLDKQGWPVTWIHHIITPAIKAYYEPTASNPEAEEVGGAIDFPYLVPNFRLEYSLAKSGVPRGWFRSVDHSFTALAVECFLDELAAAGGKDPYQLRLRLLGERRQYKITTVNSAQSFTIDTGRLRRVLDLAATRAGWGRRLPKGWGRGIAVHYSYKSYVAQVAEVSVNREGAVRVHRVVCAVDCGQVINPNGVEAMVEGGIAFGLSAALKSAITIENGRVQQSSFLNYDVVRINEMPKIEVHIVASNERPTGMGEPPVPVIAPAVANAIFAATGKRIRRLPIRAKDLRQA